MSDEEDRRDGNHGGMRFDHWSPSSCSIHPAPPVITSLSGGRSRQTRARAFLVRPRKEGFRFPLASLQLSGGRSSNGWFFVHLEDDASSNVAATRLMLCGAANFVCGVGRCVHVLPWSQRSAGQYFIEEAPPSLPSLLYFPSGAE